MKSAVLYTLAFTRLTSFNLDVALRLYRELGSGQAIYEHRHDLRDVLPDCSDRLVSALQDWSLPLSRTEQELAFVQKHGIKVLCYGDAAYPQRLTECDDAPIVLYYLGNADLNQRRIVSIVGTRHCTSYGQDLIRHFITGLREQCPEMLIISGLAYGVDISAHRQALASGYETLGVLAHGLDELYPPQHRETAKQMLAQGGLITEYMSESFIDKLNFVRRNRIVAGMSDATILVESAAKGGGLITTSIAQDYNRSVFAFPGAVGATYSVGCNNLIRNNGAQLITSATDFVESMGWQDDSQLAKARHDGIERNCFPDLSDKEQKVVNVLTQMNDSHLNLLSVKTGMSAGQLTALLFQLEMKGVVRPMAGGTYHLLK
jgi:DNA processing protein